MPELARARRRPPLGARRPAPPAPEAEAPAGAPGMILELQRSAGNAAVSRLLQRSPASEVIDKHTHFLNLREEELAGDLRGRLPGEADLVVSVFNELSWTDRDDVAVSLLEDATDDQIRAWAADASGRRALTRAIAELSSGWTTGGTGSEAAVRDRAMGLMSSDMPGADPAIADAAGTTPAGSPAELIDTHTHGFNLREHELAADLLARLPAQAAFVNRVFDELGGTDRDDVAYELMQKATDDQIRAIARDASGLQILRRMVQEMFHGVATGSEEAESQRLMRLITEVQREGTETTGTAVEVEVVTYLTGGLDFVGTLIGSRGHTAIMIGSNAYSFELGWSCGLSRAEYLRKNRNRNGVGQVLKISDEDVRKIQDGLNDACATGYYAISGDICTDSSAIALEKALGTLDSGWIPADFVGSLDGAGVVASHRYYPKEDNPTAE